MGTDPENRARVCVLDGLHRGAVIHVGEGALTVGGRPDCDALLADPPAEGCAVSLSCDDDGTVRVMARDGESRIGGRRLGGDRPKRLRKGTVLEVGGIRLGLGGDLRSAWRAVNRRRRARVGMQWGGAAVAALAMLAVIGAANGPAGAHDVASRFLPAVVQGDASISHNAVVADLEDQIARQGLDGVLSIRRDMGDARITVRGAVTAEQRARWNAVARWFDGRHGGRAMLDAKLEDRSDKVVLPFRIVSMKADPFPCVFIQDGRSFPVGSTLPGGWEVARIDGMTVVLAQGDRELTIAF